ncbi:MAG: hypothetical protein E7605_04135 [Ruminococcaceae bacterium]|nr:hypothetical protein [Oscillospiraceae bacterium]
MQNKKINETFELYGCTWKVIDRYQLTDVELKKCDLCFKNRITIECIKSNGVIPIGQIRDFGL